MRTLIGRKKKRKKRRRRQLHASPRPGILTHHILYIPYTWGKYVEDALKENRVLFEYSMRAMRSYMCGHPTVSIFWSRQLQLPRHAATDHCRRGRFAVVPRDGTHATASTCARPVGINNQLLPSCRGPSAAVSKFVDTELLAHLEGYGMPCTAPPPTYSRPYFKRPVCYSCLSHYSLVDWCWPRLPSFFFRLYTRATYTVGTSPVAQID